MSIISPCHLRDEVVRPSQAGRVLTQPEPTSGRASLHRYSPGGEYDGNEYGGLPVNCYVLFTLPTLFADLTCNDDHGHVAFDAPSSTSASTRVEIVGTQRAGRLGGELRDRQRRHNPVSGSRDS